MPAAIQVDVWFDLICPWCLIGKRQLDQALARWRLEQPDRPVHVRWHGVQLVPGVPPGGLDFAAFYEQRLGSKVAVQARQRQIQAAAEAAGVAIRFDLIRRFPDVGPAHRLLRHAGAHREALLDDLFDAYFCRGEDIGHVGNLLALARRHGLDVDQALALALPVTEQEAVSSVPLFAFNGRRTLAGAQAARTIFDALQATAADAVAH